MGTAEIITTVLSIIAGLGWFSSTHWPSELDDAQDQLRQFPEVDIERLETLRGEAYHYYLKHHHAAPWDKPKYLKLFQNAINNWAEAIKEEAVKVAESQGIELGYEVKPWWEKYLPYGLIVGLGTILIISLARRR